MELGGILGGVVGYMGKSYGRRNKDGLWGNYRPKSGYDTGF